MDADPGDGDVDYGSRLEAKRVPGDGHLELDHGDLDSGRGLHNPVQPERPDPGQRHLGVGRDLLPSWSALVWWPPRACAAEAATAS